MGRGLRCCIVIVPLLVGSPAWATGDWTALGPEGGNFNAVAVDPDEPETVYAIGNRNLYRRSGENARWERLSVGGGAFAVAVATGGYVYVASLGAVFRSRDHGASFERVEIPDRQGYVEAIAVDPADARIVYAADVFIGMSSISLHILRSRDAGETWLREDTPLPSSPPSSVLALAVDPTMPTTVYAALEHAGVFVSTDAGATWGAANDGLPCPRIEEYCDPCACLTSFAITSGPEPTLLAGTYNLGLFRRDGDGAWTASNDGLGPYQASALAADPNNPLTVYAGATSERFGWTHFAVFRSDDGGVTWQEGRAADLPAQIAALAVDPYNASSLYAATGDAADGHGLYRSRDRGDSWDTDQEGLTATCIAGLVAAPTRPTTLYAAVAHERRKLAIGTEAGAEWRDVSFTTRAGAPEAIAVDPNDPLRLYTANSWEGLFTTADGGTAWTQLWAADIDGLLLDLVVDPRDGFTVYTAVLGGVPDGAVKRSTDGGLSWTTVHQATTDSGEIRALAVDDATGTVYALYANALFRSRNGRTRWTQLTTSAADDRFWNVEVAPTSPPTLLLVSLRTGLRISRDDGRTWEDAALPEPRLVVATAVDPSRARALYAATATDYAGTLTQLYRSDDAGDTWNPVGQPVEASVSNVAVDPNDRSVVYAATCGSGVLRLEQDAAPAPAAAGGGGCAVSGRPDAGTGLASLALAALAVGARRRRRSRPVP